MVTTDWAAYWAINTPTATAFTDGTTGKSLSFQQLHQQGEQLVARLQTQVGLVHGDRIAVLAENCLAYPILFVAAQKAGFILTPINYRLSTPEVAYILEDAQPKLLLTEDQFLPLVRAFLQTAELTHWTITEVYAADFPAPPPVLPTIADTDPIFILYTSGTTGFPKGAMYTHRMLFWNSVNTALSLVINAESRTVNVMPPFHTGGWNVLTTPLLHRGGHTLLLRQFSAEHVLSALAEQRATVFMAVPTMLRMLAEAPAFKTADLSALHYIIVGGEALPLTVIETWHNRGIPIRQGFGMTEVGPNLFSLHQKDANRKIGSIGRSNFYVETNITDENGDPCPVGVPGELCLRGPMVTPGYWQNPEATKKAFRNGWFRTGDIVKCDDDGFFYVVGRLKEMYISGGENVYPAEIENWLEKHASINEVAVIGVPDERWGEVGHAFVVPAPVILPGPDELTAYCRKGLARFKIPKVFTTMKSLPKNGAGKIDRKALKGLQQRNS